MVEIADGRPVSTVSEIIDGRRWYVGPTFGTAGPPARIRAVNDHFAMRIQLEVCSGTCGSAIPPAARSSMRDLLDAPRSNHEDLDLIHGLVAFIRNSGAALPGFLQRGRRARRKEGAIATLRSTRAAGG
jgi:hypothetical protein